MAFITLEVNPNAEPLPSYIVNKHYMRKHGPNAYYGQSGAKH
jgi:L-ribulose-5-phosphate 4-epimerase